MKRTRMEKHSCGRMVLRIETDFALMLLVEPDPIPVGTRPFDGYEKWREGWHHVASRAGNRHRGYPIHVRHICPSALPSER